MSSTTLAELVTALNGVETEAGLTFSSELMNDGVDMVKVEVEDREEFPVFISIDEDQILCTTYLWREGEVKADRKGELLEAALTMNVPMPLSSFGKVGDQYLLFGAMSTHSSVDDVRLEIETLSENTLSAIETMADFLN